MIQITSATPNPIPATQTITVTANGPIDAVEIKPLPKGVVLVLAGNSATTVTAGPFTTPGPYQITVNGTDGTSDSMIATAN